MEQTEMKQLTIEAERKFVLKNIPDIEYDAVYLIEQYYLPDGLRIRQKTKLKTEESEYEATTKTKHEFSGASYEKNNKISAKEFKVLKRLANKVVVKQRYVKNIEDDLKWEIDEFKNIHLVMAEIEMVCTEDKIDDTYLKLMNQGVPKFISDELIVEVTGLKKFSNAKLATSFNKK